MPQSDRDAATAEEDESAPPRADRRRVVTILGITQILAWGSSYYLLAVLARPIAADTGWPLSWIVGAMSVGLLVSGLVSPRVGRTIDRRGGRPVLAGSAVFLAAGLALLAAAPNLVGFVLAWMILGVGMGAGLYDPAFATLGRLYGRDARSAITALTLFGGFASTVCWPLSAWLVGAVGWRGACLAYALIQLFISLPLYLLALPPPPERRTAAAKPESRQGAEPPRAPLDRRRLLYVLLALGLTMASVIAATMSVHLLTILEARGIGLETAVALGAAVGPSQVGARVIEMLLGRRFHPVWTMVSATLLLSAGLGLLFAGSSGVALGLVLYGAGNGLNSIVRGTLPLVLFGAEGYASLIGRLARPLLLAQAAAPALAALVLERYGAASILALLIAAALSMLAAALVLAFLVRQDRRQDPAPA